MLNTEHTARATAGLYAVIRTNTRLGQVVVNAESSKVDVPRGWIDDTLHDGSREAYAAGADRPDIRWHLGNGQLSILLDG